MKHVLAFLALFGFLGSTAVLGTSSVFAGEGAKTTKTMAKTKKPKKPNKKAALDMHHDESMEHAPGKADHEHPTEEGSETPAENPEN